MSKRSMLIASSILLALLLPVYSIASNSKESIDAEGIFIDQGLPEKDKKKIKEVMLLLDKEHRENVIHINEDGSIISNRKQLLEDFKEKNKELLDSSGKFKERPANWIKNEVFPNDREQNFDSASLLSTGWKYPDYQSENVNSGPYRRVYSNVGYSRLVTDVWVPSRSSGIYMASGNDKAYVYTGAVDSNGKGIDIGLAYNYEQGPYKWNETWGVFIKGANDSTIDMPEEYNFVGGQSVVMDFYTWANNAVALFSAGYTKAGNYAGGTMTAELGSSYRFWIDGTGMKVKRITSIAQAPQNLNSGSELNYVHWTNVRIGQRYNPATSQDWGLFYGYPRTSILVDYTSQSDEKVWVKAGTLTPP